MTLLAYGFSPFTLLVVLVVVLLLFGNRLPATMRSLGRGVTEFKKGLSGEGEEEAEEAPAKRVKQQEE